LSRAAKAHAETLYSICAQKARGFLKKVDNLQLTVGGYGIASGGYFHNPEGTP